MARETHRRVRDRFGLRDVPGTTLAVASLAILGAAAVVATPVWLWYRRKRKRADALASHPATTEPTSEETPKTAPPA
jgi:hypothetical protein